MKKISLSFIFMACVIRAMGGNVIPPELVGAWAPADAEMQGSILLAGYAIYINTNGHAAVAVAPPTTGRPWDASYDATNHLLKLTLNVPGMSSAEGMTNYFVYDSRAKTLSLTNAPTKETATLTRRTTRIPGGVIESLK